MISTLPSESYLKTWSLKNEYLEYIVPYRTLSYRTPYRKQLGCTWKCNKGCGGRGGVGEAGRAGVVGGSGHGFSHRAALLQAGRHLGDGVSSDTCATSRGRVGVVLHHGGEHGNVVALGAYHWVLGDGGVARFQGPGALQTLFWRERERVTVTKKLKNVDLFRV